MSTNYVRVAVVVFEVVDLEVEEEPHVLLLVPDRAGHPPAGQVPRVGVDPVRYLSPRSWMYWPRDAMPLGNLLIFQNGKKNTTL